MRPLKPSGPRSYSRVWHRPSRWVVILVGIGAAVVGERLKGKGIGELYTETALTALLLLWGLLAAFRTGWRRYRFWFAIAVIAGSHVVLWVMLERRTGHLGFVSMFVLVAAEFVIGSTFVVKAIPEDAALIRDYIRQW